MSASTPPAPAPRIPPALWPAVSAGFDEALALPAAARADWLARQAAAQPEVAFHLGRLLAAHATAQQPARPDTALFAAALAAPRRLFEPGQTVGIYRLVAPLGEGGMAVVWSAEQLQGVPRRVALKLPHAGLEHPHIARLYDAGITDDGQPFLAMELISGQSLTRHAQGLPLAGRLALFQQVLAAVSFAHGRLVIHRDLKPGNVLVTPEGEVKLLDFGIARLLGDGEPAPAGTGLSGQAFTPDCAAPEQLAGQPLDVRADVYALGVVLYELLAGRRPYLLQREASTPLVEQLARLAAAGWPAPSQRLPAAAGDLDAIVARAMAADPALRYASVDALAADLRRFERLQPVQARRGGRAYRLSLWLRRQRLAVAAGTAVVLALGGGLGVALWQAHVARAQAARAEAVKGFVLGIFNAVDPRRPSDQPRGQTTARQLMDLATERIDRDFAHDPALRIELLGVVANIYGYLAEDERYEALHRRQMALAQQHLGETHPVYIQGLLVDAYGDIFGMQPEAAKATLAQVDALIRRAGLEASEQRAAWWMAQSEVLRGVPGAHAQRTQALERAIALYRAHAPRSEDYPAALANLGNVHNAREAWPQAQALYEEALAVPLAPGGSEENLSVIHTNLGLSLMEQGQVAAGLRHFQTATDMALRTYGPGHSNHFHATGNHARWLHRVGDRREAMALFDSLPVAAGGNSPGDDTAREYHAAALLMEGRPDLALRILKTVQQAYARRVNREADQRRLDGLLGTALAQTGDAAGARERLWAALQASQQYDAPASVALATARERWARYLLDQGDPQAWTQAPPLLALAAQATVVAGPTRRPAPVALLAQLGLARVALGRGDLAAAAQAVQTAQALWPQLPASREQRLAGPLWAVQAELLQRQGQAAQAQALRAQAAASAAAWAAPAAAPGADPWRLAVAPMPVSPVSPVAPVAPAPPPR
ncbi:MAG: protein kinase domain-containing protein [Rubrivivax sp.]